MNDRTINLDFNNTFRIFEGTLYSGFYTNDELNVPVGAKKEQSARGRLPAGATLARSFFLVPKYFQGPATQVP